MYSACNPKVAGLSPNIEALWIVVDSPFRAFYWPWIDLRDRQAINSNVLRNCNVTQLQSEGRKGLLNHVATILTIINISVPVRQGCQFALLSIDLEIPHWSSRHRCCQVFVSFHMGRDSWRSLLHKRHNWSISTGWSIRMSRTRRRNSETTIVIYTHQWWPKGRLFKVEQIKIIIQKRDGSYL